MIAVSAQEKTSQLSLKERVKRVEQINRQTNNYTQKLDSIVTDDYFTLAFDYDHNYRRTSTKTYYYGMLMLTQLYFYDYANHLLYTTIQYPYSTDKIEYSYNAQGLVIEEIQYEENGDSWYPETKVTYEYNSSGQLVLALEQDYQNNTWKNDNKSEYTYAGGKLTQVITNAWNATESLWWPHIKEEYSYNGSGNCTSLIEYSRFSTGDWINDNKYIYEYDSHNNCIKETDYYYRTMDGWTLDEIIEFTYDLSVPSSTIAFYEEMFANSVITINNKLVSVVESSYDDDELEGSATSTLYYSFGVQVPETQNSIMRLSPNPTSERLSVKVENLKQVELFGMDGKHVATIETGFEDINVSSLANGCYLVKATLKDGSVTTQKFLKQ